MSTEYTEIYDLIRAAVLDNDSNIQMYSDDVLAGQINLSILGYDQTAYAKSSATQFTNTLTPAEKLVLAIEIAIRLLSGVPSEFSFSNPVMSSRRKGGVSHLVPKLEELLDDARGGRFAFSSETSTKALIQHFDRYIRDVNDAYIPE